MNTPYANCKIKLLNVDQFEFQKNVEIRITKLFWCGKKQKKFSQKLFVHALYVICKKKLQKKLINFYLEIICVKIYKNFDLNLSAINCV